MRPGDPPVCALAEHADLYRQIQSRLEYTVRQVIITGYQGLPIHLDPVLLNDAFDRRSYHAAFKFSLLNDRANLSPVEYF
jgi:hypothetical protein